MRISPAIQALVPSLRGRILGALFLHADREWYGRDLAKHLQVTPSSLQRELARLASAGILRQRRDGNRVYYQADPECPFFAELRGLMIKTAGLVDVLQMQLSGLIARIDVALVYGSVARHEETSSSDIDLMIIGSPTRFDLTPSLKNAEAQLGRPVNLTLYKSAEFAKKFAIGSHFIRTVLDKEMLFVVGNRHDLERTCRAKTRRRRTDKQAGD